jgi:multicomponent Na+:H+ antiporter subunit D
MLVGILGAIAQSDIKRMLSFTLVSHIGYLVLGISLATRAGTAGTTFYVVHHITIQTALFLVLGLVERRAGSTALMRIGGLARLAPLLAVLFFVPAMNLAGIPPLSGFIGKLGLLQAGVAEGGVTAYVLVAGGVVTSLLTLLAITRVWTRAFWRPPTQAPADDTAAAAAADAGPAGHSGPQGAAGDGAGDGALTARQAAWRRHARVATAADPDLAPPAGAVRALRPLPRAMVAATAALVAVTVALTGIAGFLYGLADRAAADLVERTPYVDAVFDAPAAEDAE